MAAERYIQPELDDAEAHVQRVLVSRQKANASGQRGEDIQNIRAAYLAGTPEQEHSEEQC